MARAPLIVGSKQRGVGHQVDLATPGALGPQRGLG